MIVEIRANHSLLRHRVEGTAFIAIACDIFQIRANHCCRQFARPERLVAACTRKELRETLRRSFEADEEEHQRSRYAAECFQEEEQIVITRYNPADDKDSNAEAGANGRVGEPQDLLI